MKRRPIKSKSKVSLYKRKERKIQKSHSTMWLFAYRVHVFYIFFFFFARICWLWRQIFTHCAYTVYVLKNIKNRSHDTIYTFKNYFVAVFSVFSNNKLNPNGPYDSSLSSQSPLEIRKWKNKKDEEVQTIWPFSFLSSLSVSLSFVLLRWEISFVT